jgi:hypothetical protein
VRSWHQLPITRVWAATGISGVPFGAQTAWLSISTTGWPFDITRVAATTHVAVTQGTGPPETLNGHPATTHGAVITTLGWPLTITLGFGAVGVAVPP